MCFLFVAGAVILSPVFVDNCMGGMLSQSFLSLLGLKLLADFILILTVKSRHSDIDIEFLGV